MQPKKHKTECDKQKLSAYWSYMQRRGVVDIARMRAIFDGTVSVLPNNCVKRFVLLLVEKGYLLETKPTRTAFKNQIYIVIKRAKTPPIEEKETDESR